MNPDELLDTRSGLTGIAIGNGPSLKQVPSAFLYKYDSFGVNYIHLLPFQPTYYVCVDTPVLTLHADEIFQVASSAKFAFLSSYHLGDQNPALQRLYSLRNAVLLGQDTFSLPGERVMSGWTAVYVALKIAYSLGFSTMLVVGVDHTAKWEHFSDDYPAGNPMDARRFEGQREHFHLAAAAYSAAGRHIVNLSPPSELDNIFPRGKFEDWL